MQDMTHCHSHSIVPGGFDYRGVAPDSGTDCASRCIRNISDVPEPMCEQLLANTVIENYAVEIDHG